MMVFMRADMYFSVDIEADGPIPGPYSMVSFGVTVAGVFDTEFQPSDPDTTTFYRELQPISEDFVPEALAVSGLDRASLVRFANLMRWRASRPHTTTEG
jgi:hypothetical protein